MLCHAGGVLGVGTWNFASAVKEDVIEVTGTQAVMRFQCFNNQPIQIIHAGAVAAYEEYRPSHMAFEHVHTAYS